MFTQPQVAFVAVLLALGIAQPDLRAPIISNPYGVCSRCIIPVSYPTKPVICLVFLIVELCRKWSRRMSPPSSLRVRHLMLCLHLCVLAAMSSPQKPADAGSSPADAAPAAMVTPDQPSRFPAAGAGKTATASGGKKPTPIGSRIPPAGTSGIPKSTSSSSMSGNTAAGVSPAAGAAAGAGAGAASGIPRSGSISKIPRRSPSGISLNGNGTPSTSSPATAGAVNATPSPVAARVSEPSAASPAPVSTGAAAAAAASPADKPSAITAPSPSSAAASAPTASAIASPSAAAAAGSSIPRSGSTDSVASQKSTASTSSAAAGTGAAKAKGLKLPQAHSKKPSGGASTTG